MITTCTFYVCFVFQHVATVLENYMNAAANLVVVFNSVFFFFNCIYSVPTELIIKFLVSIIEETN